MIFPIDTFFEVYELDEKDLPLPETQKNFISENMALLYYKKLENEGKNVVMMRMGVRGQ
jgi:hypothetical protein